MLTLALVLALQSQAPPTTTVTVSTSEQYRFQAPLDSGGGDVALSQARVSVELFQALSASDFVKLLGSVNSLRYDWSGSASGLSENLRDLRMEGWFIHAFHEKWRGIAYTSAHVQYEEGAETGDAASYGGAVGLVHRFGPELSVGAMIGAFTRIEDSPFHFIQPHIEWKPSPWWTLRTEARDGFVVESTHILDDDREWALLGRVNYTTRRFRLDEDAVNPEGIFEDSRIALLAGLRWQPSPSTSLSLHAGLDLAQEFKLEDARGESVHSFETDSAFILGIQATINF